MNCKNCGKEIEDGLELCQECQKPEEPVQAAVQEENTSSENLSLESQSKKQQQELLNTIKEKAKKIIGNYKNFKNLSTKQKIIHIVAPLLIIAIMFSGGESKGPVKVKQDNDADCYYFNIKYNDFCEQMAGAISDVAGVSESKVKKYCKSITPYDDNCDFCDGDVLLYEIEVESGKYVAVLKIKVFVDPKTDKVIWVEVFKANGSSSAENFATLANRASEVLCGKKVTKLENHVVETRTYSGNNITYIQYKDYKLDLEEGTGSYTTGDMKRLEIYIADAD